MRILVANAGSTSLKLRVVEDDDRVSDAADLDPPGESLRDDLRRFLAAVGPVDAIGHRVVHGGASFTGPVVIDSATQAQLNATSNLAPLHNPPALAAIDAMADLAPNVPAIACFDTAFHCSLSLVASTYALPQEWVERWGVRRYGFHGLSCEWSVRRAAQLLDRPADSLRLVICHLGGGASVTATANGKSVDTTMGFTPTEGLVMATRPGDVDPGALAWLSSRGIGPDELLDALERRSGLLALSGGTSGDMRVLLQRRAHGDPTATFAIQVYVHRLHAKIAAMAAATEGTDALVFTGGVGENAGEIRADTCGHLGWIGISLDDEVNGTVTSEDADISRDDAEIRTLVVHAREELVVAAGCRRALRR